MNRCRGVDWTGMKFGSESRPDRRDRKKKKKRGRLKFGFRRSETAGWMAQRARGGGERGTCFQKQKRPTQPVPDAPPQNRSQKLRWCSWASGGRVSARCSSFIPGLRLGQNGPQTSWFKHRQAKTEQLLVVIARGGGGRAGERRGRSAAKGGGEMLFCAVAGGIARGTSVTRNPNPRGNFTRPGDNPAGRNGQGRKKTGIASCGPGRVLSGRIAREPKRTAGGSRTASGSHCREPLPRAIFEQPAGRCGGVNRVAETKRLSGGTRRPVPGPGNRSASRGRFGTNGRKKKPGPVVRRGARGNQGPWGAGGRRGRSGPEV